MWNSRSAGPSCPAGPSRPERGEVAKRPVALQRLFERPRRLCRIPAQHHARRQLHFAVAGSRRTRLARTQKPADGTAHLSEIVEMPQFVLEPAYAGEIRPDLFRGIEGCEELGAVAQFLESDAQPVQIAFLPAPGGAA